MVAFDSGRDRGPPVLLIISPTGLTFGMMLKNYLKLAKTCYEKAEKGIKLKMQKNLGNFLEQNSGILPKDKYAKWIKSWITNVAKFQADRHSLGRNALLLFPKFLALVGHNLVTSCCSQENTGFNCHSTVQSSIDIMRRSNHWPMSCLFLIPNLFYREIRVSARTRKKWKPRHLSYARVHQLCLRSIIPWMHAEKHSCDSIRFTTPWIQVLMYRKTLYLTFRRFAEFIDVSSSYRFRWEYVQRTDNYTAEIVGSRSYLRADLSQPYTVALLSIFGKWPKLAAGFYPGHTA